LSKLNPKVESHNQTLLAKLYSEDEIQQLKAELDSFKAIAQGCTQNQGTLYAAVVGAYSYATGFFSTTSGKTAEREMQAKRRARSAQKDYSVLREKVNKTIAENAQDGLAAVDGGNFEIAGSVLRFKSLVESRLKEHLDVVASKEMENFEQEVEELLRGKLDKLLIALKDGPDVRRAITDLGYSLEIKHLFRGQVCNHTLAVGSALLLQVLLQVSLRPEPTSFDMVTSSPTVTFTPPSPCSGNSLPRACFYLGWNTKVVRSKRSIFASTWIFFGHVVVISRSIRRNLVKF